MALQHFRIFKDEELYHTEYPNLGKGRCIGKVEHRPKRGRVGTRVVVMWEQGLVTMECDKHLRRNPVGVKPRSAWCDSFANYRSRGGRYL